MDSPDITLPEIVRSAHAATEVNLRFTVLYHPEFSVIGRIADIGLTSARHGFTLNRFEPVFSDPRSPEKAGLDDPYISRSAILFEFSDDGLSVTRAQQCGSLSVDGQQVDKHLLLSEAALSSGVVLVLSRRVTLCLKLAQPSITAPPELGLVGESDVLQRVRRSIEVAASCNLPVLILGPSGSGKELAARAIHDTGSRHDQSYLAINMAAIPVELASTELFGVSKGAFTGADRDRAGFFLRANGGTLFLDEIGACPPELQTLLLRVLETGEVQIPGGSSSTVDVRVIAATDANLSDGSADFSLALKHRLGGIEVTMPTLNERIEDLGRLVRAFIEAYEEENSVNLHHGDSDPVAAAQWCAWVSAMAGHDWSGNVRQLRNHCQQVAVASDYEGAFNLPANISADLEQKPARGESQQQNYRNVSQISADEISEVLHKCDYELAAAARFLNVPRPSLYKRVQAIPQIRLASDLSVSEIEESHHRHQGNLWAAAQEFEVSAPALLRRWHALELEARSD